MYRSLKMNKLLNEILNGNECPRKIKEQKHKDYLATSNEIDNIFLDLSDGLTDNDKLFEKLMKYERLHIRSERLLKDEYFIKGFLLAVKITGNN